MADQSMTQVRLKGLALIWWAWNGIRIIANVCYGLEACVHPYPQV